MMEGIVVIDKPAGITSHDVVARVRRRFNMKRVGHAGTLDPLATGVLIVLLGKATKLFDQFMGMDKAYRSTLQLGLKTSTADTQGQTLVEKDFKNISSHKIHDVFGKYQGELKQLPPMYSAVKFKGKKLYELARKGIVVEREPRQIRIDRLEIENISLPHVQFYLECSKGTYVRQLAEDIGEDLGCGACISQIQRVKVGQFSLSEAISLEDLNENHIRHWESSAK